MTPGCIVRCRNRDWVLLPSEREDLYLLRPLTGATDEVVAVHKGLSDLVGGTLPEERVRPSRFEPPTADDLSDAASAHLLWQAARLTLRDGAAPFRSLGRVSVRPRIYQFVPLLMALRLDPVRLLVADDVGVGKTIEALLVARELLDRGEVRRLCVLRPPYLCDQWQKELAEKFSLDAAVIRSGTIGQLEREAGHTRTIYEHFPIQVASVDFVKSDRNKHLFLLHCPELVIVDEAHGCTLGSSMTAGQQQRHQLVRDLAADEKRHLILLTATPHSGIEASFRSLLSLLRPAFGSWDTATVGEAQRVELARHFVQRTRRDIERDWEGDHCFPTRDPSDEVYPLSPAYRDLFDRTYDFCSEMVRGGEELGTRQRRVRYWAALALLRCVMSSPAAAVAALSNRLGALVGNEDEPDFRSFVFESADDRTDDDHPTPPLEAADATLGDGDRRRLRELGRQAAALEHTRDDRKLVHCAELVNHLLDQGFHPIVWCRYVATADYLAEGLERALAPSRPDLRVVSVTGRLGDDERRAKVEELGASPRRVLVATDCLSEGVNLQRDFNAVLHYDLPWNPNRLEQREGRVDRYGQKAEVVKAIRYFSPDSAVDGVVIDVLLDKAREIHRVLGTHVPVPAESESVTEAVLNALFLRGVRRTRASTGEQLALDFGVPEVEAFHRRWVADAERERVNRTRFAQRALKPADVRQELEATDEVLGDPDAVKAFVVDAAQRLNLQVAKDRRDSVYRVNTSPEALAHLPGAVTFALPRSKSGTWLVTFSSPTPEGAEYLGRNHPFVAALARYLMEEALTRSGAATATRCGAIRTRAVERVTTVLLLRSRYLLHQPGRTPLLSEEVRVEAVYTAGGVEQPSWLPDHEALRLLAAARPDANIPMPEKRALVEEALAAWPTLEEAVGERIRSRAAELETSHKRVRQAVGLRVRELRVEPQLPPDLLGVLVLQPMAGETRRGGDWETRRLGEGETRRGGA